MSADDEGGRRAQPWARSREESAGEPLADALHHIARDHEEAADRRPRDWRWFLVVLPVV